MITTVSFPEQKISSLKKNEEWKKACIDAAITFINYEGINHHKKTASDKQVNYDLVNGIINDKDFSYVINPLGLDDNYGGQPAKLKCYPLIQTKLSFLKGEELKRRFRYRAICTGGLGQELREQKKIEALKQYVTNNIYKELGINANNLPEGFETPKQIIDFFDYTYEDSIEIYCNRILKQLEKELELKSKFNEGFNHAAIVAEEIYKVYIKNDKPALRVCDTRFITYFKSDESNFIEDSFFVKEERYLSVSEIVDEFGEYLKDEEINQIETGNINANVYHAFAQSNTNNSFVRKNRQGLIPVYQITWKSLKQVCFLHYVDEKNKNQTEIIYQEDFELTSEQKKDKRNRVEKIWITEVWQGTKIGDSIYVDIRPTNVQTGKLPYVGGIYNNLNSIPTSIVDYMKIYQHTYNIIWYRLNIELAKAQGKKIAIDLSLIPKTEGFSIEKWMYYFINTNIVWYNGAEEGQSQGNNVASQMIKDYDLSLSQSVGIYMQYLSKIEQMIGQIVGISPQTEAQISPYETSSTINGAVQASRTILEPFFYQHDLIKRNVLTQLLEISKFCYKEQRNKKTMFLNSDFIRESFEIDTEILQFSDLGIFINDNTQDEITFDLIKQNAQSALQNQLIKFSDLINVYKTNSVAEAVNIIKQGEDKREEIQQKQSESQQQIEQEKIKAEQDKLYKEQQFELLIQQNELNSKERLKQMDIAAQYGAKDDSPDFNTVVSNNIKQQETDNKYSVEKMKSIQEQNNKSTENLLKLKELSIKEKDVETKFKIAKTNKNKYDK